jgi:EAL domain-containing protein (putative c-di-GMP-specific phosphodiesterase class I)
MGITVYPEGGTSVSALMRNADAAMYSAKEAGGSIYKIYTKDMNENSLNNLIMENSLRKALDNDEFFLEYQPIFDCNDLKILGAEVLCRWKLDNDIIPPGSFIPLAKKIGEITRIDNWVLKQACCQCKEWQNNGLNDMYISVNVSFKQIRQSGFADYVIHILNETELDPKYLNLEITEDEAMEDPDFTIKILKQLRNKGVQISIDDFGSGYSSLSYINRLPLNTIKIDKSLIDNINDRTNLEIIRSVIALAGSLNLNVVSEGIEMDVQYAVLKSLNCKSVQGYLFSKPLGVDKFHEKFIKSEHKNKY